MQNKKIIIIAQVLISFMMALLMSGIFSFINLGFTELWIKTWLSNFIVAWPIAFILSLFVSALAFKLSENIYNFFSSKNLKS